MSVDSLLVMTDIGGGGNSQDDAVAPNPASAKCIDAKESSDSG